MRAATAHLATITGPGYFISLALGAAAGAWLAGSLNTLNGMRPTLSHSVLGALAGAIVAVEIYKAARGIKESTGAAFVGAFALGVAVGRWGCLFAGLPDFTYGTPTHLPWAVDLGDGVGRHPVQIYESVSMIVFLAVWLWGLGVRASWALRRGFYALCVWYGAQRFVWEFLKPYAHVVGPFNVFHLLCAGLVAYGLVFYLRDLAGERRGDRATQGRALSFPGPDHEPV
ncbi:prolipoprotein diacylglyceryl transferase [Caulobacter sp. S45]|uniref:prolipoprotein diacylglyceryl transferase n=1 Tax=Caulobacter sp. S45 TaxID=1641861 RepID=UPI0020B1211A|nr:prolipoprotein diacylglyceryl transferase family protein [Caulobacter sp. S45]